jgi:exodeoxyribonuclease-3
MPLTVATWNVNSVKSRLGILTDYLRSDAAPDVLLLQETKTADDGFPLLAVEDSGYNAVLCGQKTYNGVAILSKYPVSECAKGLGGAEQGESRYIEALIETPSVPLRVASVYVPNGQAPDSPKFPYKLAFMDALYRKLQELLALEEPVLCGGDFNAVFDPEADTHDPAGLEGTACCHPEERRRMQAYSALGYGDLFRVANPDKKQFTWWDYRAGMRQKNRGLRIDHLLGSPEVTDRLVSCHVEEELRDRERPSDHTPVCCRLAAA